MLDLVTHNFSNPTDYRVDNGVLVDDQDDYNHQSRAAVERDFPIDFRGGGPSPDVDTLTVTVRKVDPAHLQARARRRQDRRDAAARRDFRHGSVE